MKTAERLTAHGIDVEELNNVGDIPVYIDGADEVTPAGAMIKGGGGALTREKIVAAVARIYGTALLTDFPTRAEVIADTIAAAGRLAGLHPLLRLPLAQLCFPALRAHPASTRLRNASTVLGNGGA